MECKGSRVQLQKHPGSTEFLCDCSGDGGNERVFDKATFQLVSS